LLELSFNNLFESLFAQDQNNFTLLPIYLNDKCKQLIEKCKLKEVLCKFARKMSEILKYISQ